MSLTNEQIIEAIASKSVTEIVELITAMEEKFGVSAAAAVAAREVAPGAADAAVAAAPAQSSDAPVCGASAEAGGRLRTPAKKAGYINLYPAKLPSPGRGLVWLP